MSWQLHVPCRGRDDSLVEVGGFVRHLEGEHRLVARELAMYAATELGMSTAGELLDHLEASGPAERRELLDHARSRAGLDDTETVDGIRRARMASDAGRARAAANSPWQLCHADGCNVQPMNSLGAPMMVSARRWFCDQHRHLAQPGDMEPPGPGVRISESGALVPIDEHEKAREAAKAESRRVELEARLAESEAGADAVREYRRAREEEVRRLLPPGVPG